jgi:hypothetical protein
MVQQVRRVIPENKDLKVLLDYRALMAHKDLKVNKEYKASLV